MAGRSVSSRGALLPLLLGAAVLVSAAGAAAQTIPIVGQKVRVQTPVGRVTGRVLQIDSVSMVIAAADLPDARELRLDTGLVRQLQVSVGRRNRVLSALVGAFAGAAFPLGARVIQRQYGCRDGCGHFMYSYMALGGALGLEIGFLWPGERWRPGRLAAPAPTP